MPSISTYSPLACPICAPGTSQINLPGAVTAATLPAIEYVDAAGAYHKHDPNLYQNTYHCSQGHLITQPQTILCPSCTFNQ